MVLGHAISKSFALSKNTMMMNGDSASEDDNSFYLYMEKDNFPG